MSIVTYEVKAYIYITNTSNTFLAFLYHARKLQQTDFSEEGGENGSDLRPQSFFQQLVLSPVYSDTTQLNSTRRRVELS